MSLESNDMVMPVAPYYGGGNGGFGNFGGDGGWLVILFLFALMGGWTNNGNNGNGSFFPWAYSNNTDNLITSGFDQAATAGTLAGIQSSITNGFSNAEVSACNRAMDAMQTAYSNQIASMNQSFANSQDLNSRLDGIAMSLQNCCCENRASIADLKYTIATEACADRAAVTAGTQRILDKLCDQELQAERRENQNLRSELMYARGQASQIEQTAAIRAGQVAEVDALYNRLAACPVPTYNVPNPNCCNTGCGCGSF